MSTKSIDYNKLLEIDIQEYNHYIEKVGSVNIGETHRPFEGFPSKSPFNSDLIRLFSEPFLISGQFYEFYVENIGKIEDLGKITNEKGETVNKVRIWAKKGSAAIKSESFIIK